MTGIYLIAQCDDLVTESKGQVLVFFNRHSTTVIKSYEREAKKM